VVVVIIRHALLKFRRGQGAHALRLGRVVRLRCLSDSPHGLLIAEREGTRPHAAATATFQRLHLWLGAPRRVHVLIGLICLVIRQLLLLVALENDPEVARNEALQLRLGIFVQAQELLGRDGRVLGKELLLLGV